MSIPLTRSRFRNLLESLGKPAMSALYPNDFEYYACALELVDSRDNVVYSLIFPVMPSEINESSISISNIKKTNSGVISIFNPTFVPIDLKIDGDFGRKFRIMVNDVATTFTGIVGNLVRGKSISNFESPEFDLKVKTGYGVIKHLQKIYEKSFKLDIYGKPHKCYFYNLALNSHYLVELKNLTNNQTQQDNMIWKYSLLMKAIAPAYSIKKKFKSSLTTILTFDIISDGLTSLASDYTQTFRSRQNKFFGNG